MLSLKANRNSLQSHNLALLCTLSLFCITSKLYAEEKPQSIDLNKHSDIKNIKDIQESIPVSKASRRRLKTPVHEPQPWALTASYYGEMITHLGLSLGVERELNTSLITTRMPRPLLAKQRLKQRFLIGQFTTYNHPKNQLAMMLMAGIGVRYIKRWQSKFELLTTLGYMHQFRHGLTYVVNEDGQLETRRVAHTPKFAWQFALGLGQDFSKRPWKPSPWAWHLRPGILLEIPYNTAFLPHLTLEAGITYRLGVTR